MLPIKQQLVEVIRILEKNNHVFENDPVPITESLKCSNKSMVERLITRATRIDSSQSILKTIKKVDTRLKLSLRLISIVWLVLGFLGLFTLMQTPTVNFFYVLVSLLGLHTIMLFSWLITIFKSYFSKQTYFPWLFTPKFFIRQANPVSKATVELYTTQLQQNGMRWYIGKINHQLWLATLLGMIGAIVLLLTVRQYSFNWQSTLLSTDTLVSLVQSLAWLPSQFGFAVPDANDVLLSQHISHGVAQTPQTQYTMTNLAQKWSGLLIGSMLCYGVFPRILAWFTCMFLFSKQTFKLPLHTNYYQNLIQTWSTRIIDPDNKPQDTVLKAPVATLSHQTGVIRLACLLETPLQSELWTDNVLESDWKAFDYNESLINDREDLVALLHFLSSHAVQLLIGIRSEALPDRGMMRKLDKIAQACSGGVIVKLLHNDASRDTERDEQWHKALAERGIGLV